MNNISEIIEKINKIADHSVLLESSTALTKNEKLKFICILSNINVILTLIEKYKIGETTIAEINLNFHLLEHLYNERLETLYNKYGYDFIQSLKLEEMTNEDENEDENNFFEHIEFLNSLKFEDIIKEIDETNKR